MPQKKLLVIKMNICFVHFEFNFDVQNHMKTKKVGEKEKLSKKNLKVGYI